MDPHLLRTFVTVARLGSFSAAAAELGYTQSAVSQHIASLEKEAGTALLVRRPVAPTAAGARLLEHAGPILLRLAAAKADLARLAATPATRLLLGTSAPAGGAGRLAEALRDLRRLQPRLDVSLRSMGRRAVTEGVAAGELDLGLVDGAVASGDPLYLPAAGHLATALLSEEPIGVLLPAGHPLGGRPGLQLPDLAMAGWIDAPDTAVPLSELRAVAGPGPGAFPAALSYQGEDLSTLISLVAAGHGLAAVPERFAGRLARRLCVDPAGLVGEDDASTRDSDPLSAVWVPLTEPPLVHRTELLQASTLTPAAARLVTLLVGARRR
jgi:DNA-binding transcriptional LysR family regulator